jgi:Xaa-Pro aminopeptidase
MLLYGDTIRYPALRHEIPLAILDRLLFVARDGRALVLASSLEAERISKVLPDAELLLIDELGFYELLEDGMSLDEAELETAIRAVGRWSIRDAVVPGDLPVAVADRLRDAGVRIDVDASAVEGRRRVKNPAELAGIRRAQRAAEAGMAAAETLIRGATPHGGRLLDDGEVLTAEKVRSEIRAACAAAGAPAPPDIMVTSALSSGGHDPGTGPLPADLPIVVDLWRGERLLGGHDPNLRRGRRDGPGGRSARRRPRGAGSGAWRRASRDHRRSALRHRGGGRRACRSPDAAHASARAAAHARVLLRPRPRRRSRGARSPVPRAHSSDTLVAGDVVAIEPGIEGLEGIGGVRFEDLLLITDDGCETFTRYAYDL